MIGGRDLLDGIDIDLSSLSVDIAAVRKFVSEDVARALARKHVPTTKLRQPKADILLPSIEALRYSGLRAEIANLVASAMDERSYRMVLPAYVEVLKQLTRDEMNLLQRVPVIGRFAPIVDLVYAFRSGQVAIGYRHIVPDYMASGCVTRANIPQYVDNLIRLGLLERPVNEQAADEHYRYFGRSRFLVDLQSRPPARARAVIQRGVIGVTDFGDCFRRACLTQSPLYKLAPETAPLPLIGR